jgi:hypothetical protein
MNTIIARILNKEAIARGESHHWMDFYKLFDLISHLNPKDVYIALKGDEEWTGGYIIEDHVWVEDYYFVHSNWAIPYAIFTDDNEEEIEITLCTTQQQYHESYYEDRGVKLRKLYVSRCKTKKDGGIANDTTTYRKS